MLSLSNVWDLSRLSFLYSVISLVTFLCSFFRASRHAWRFLLMIEASSAEQILSKSLYLFFLFREWLRSAFCSFWRCKGNDIPMLKTNISSVFFQNIALFWRISRMVCSHTIFFSILFSSNTLLYTRAELNVQCSTFKVPCSPSR